MANELYLAKNGRSTAKLWYFAGGSFLERDAARSFRETILKIADAELPLHTFEHLSDVDGNPAIVLTSAETCPEIRGLFPETLARIGDTEGFAYDTDEAAGILYIYAANPSGVWYGVHRFLENNADILWTRGVKPLGELYRCHADLPVTDKTCLEVPVFRFRGWNLCGQGSQGIHHKDADTMEMMGKNGINHNYGTYYREWAHFAIHPFGGGIGRAKLNINDLMDEHPDYFMTLPDGTPRKGPYETYINYFNLACADVIADRILDYFREYPEAGTVDFSMPDNNYFVMHHGGVNLHEQPFTTPDGVTVFPDDDSYKSTVYWCFLNHVARRVKSVYPDKLITSLAYIYSEAPPYVTLENNLVPTFAPIGGDDHYPIAPIGGRNTGSNARTYRYITGWSEKTNNLCIYNYWACFKGEIYSRPIAKKVQQDLQWYASLGVRGLCSEGLVDSALTTVRTNDVYNLNSLYIWLMCRLFWNPWADIDELTERFCRLAYGSAAPEMEEYYRLIQKGWDEMPGYVWYPTGGELYTKQFILDAGNADAILSTLETAVEKTKNHPLALARIEPIEKIVRAQIELYRNFRSEDATAAYTDAGESIVMSPENLLVYDRPSPENPWTRAIPLTVFKDYMTFANAPESSRMTARLLWDKENLYIAYAVYDDQLETPDDPTSPEKFLPMDANDTWFRRADTFAENYFVGDMTNLSTYYAYYSDMVGQHFRYVSDGAVHKDKLQPAWSTATAVHRDPDPSKRYYVHAQKIPFATFDRDWKTAVPGGAFALNSRRYGIQCWLGGGLWNAESIRKIELLGRETL